MYFLYKDDRIKNEHYSPDPSNRNIELSCDVSLHITLARSKAQARLRSQALSHQSTYCLEMGRYSDSKVLRAIRGYFGPPSRPKNKVAIYCLILKKVNSTSVTVLIFTIAMVTI